jgi:type II secretion system protein N
VNINPRLRRVLAYAGYPAFYLVCLALFSYVCAPWERLKNAVVTNFNASAPLHMQIEKLTWAWRFPGIVAKGVTLVGNPPPPTEPGGKPKPAPEYVVDDLFARVSMFPLLWGTTSVVLSLDGFGGSIDTSVKTSSDGRQMQIELDGVDAAKMPYLADLIGLPLGGTVTGKIDLKLPQEKMSLAEGTVELKIADLTLGDGKTKIRDMIALPTVRAGQFSMKADITEGTLKISELSTKGPDLEVVSEGRIRLMDKLDASLAELNLRFKFADAYKNKDDMTRSIFGAPGSSVPGLFDLDPKMKQAKRADGFYAWRITGPLARLSFAAGAGGGAGAPSRPGGARANWSPPPKMPAPPPPPPAPEEPAENPGE